MIEILTLKSKALSGYPIQDATERKLPVYLPPNYDSKRKEPYPVALILGGWGSKSSSYISDDSAFGISLPRRLDLAIHEGRMRSCIVGFPDGTTRFGGSQYINSASLGFYSNYLCDEICELIDANFNTYGSADRRAILGHSSGGFGALINAVLRPDRFEFVGSSAGDSYFELSLLPGLRHAIDEVEKAGGIEAFLNDFLNHPNPMSLSRSKGEAMMMLSLASVYSPSPSSPLFGDLFFDLKSGQIIPEIWEKYLSWDPIHFIPRHSESATRLKFIHLEAGKQDEYGLQLGHRRIAEILKSLQISHQLDEYSGGHGGQSWRFEGRLKILIDKMFEQ